MNRRKEYILLAIALFIIGLAAVLFFQGGGFGGTSANNPLAGKSFYIDNTRTIKRTADKYRQDGKADDAKMLDKAADQPGTTWLTGPSKTDPQANFDVAEVARTSADAASQNKLVVYQLYAIPKRDACAGYSAAGFTDREQYMDWLNRVIGALQGDAVFSVEADAVAQAVRGGCLSESEKTDRYALLNDALKRLQGAPHVVASYLDAGQAEWLPDSSELVGPLKQAGVGQARGIAVNVSSFVASDKIDPWAANLAAALGDDTGVLVDTSRNGQGPPPSDVTGDARWCNPKGRGIGPTPTTKPGKDRIDAYMYIKNIGESDGDCYGNPPAGTFVPALAIELGRNARQ